jgi:hypothetical protein
MLNIPKLKINLNVRPGGFRDHLKEVVARLTGAAIEYRIVVPEELHFWYYL